MGAVGARRHGSTRWNHRISTSSSTFSKPSLRPYRDSHHTYRRLPATGRPRAEILAEMRELAEREEPKWQRRFRLGSGLPRRIRAHRLLERGLCHQLAGQPPAPRTVAERRQVRSRDRGHDRVHARRWGGRGRQRVWHGVVGRNREHPARHADLPRPGGRRTGDHRSRDARPAERPRRLRQGGAVLRDPDGPGPPGPRLARRRRRGA